MTIREIKPEVYLQLAARFVPIQHTIDVVRRSFVEMSGGRGRRESTKTR